MKDSDEKDEWMELGVIKEIADKCRKLGWTKPTQIQREAVSEALKGRDVIGVAETGSGGEDMFRQTLLLQTEKPHVVVATPGRLLDILENTEGFSLRNTKNLVFDEADKLLDQNFGPDIDKLLQKFSGNRRTQLYSATMTHKVQKLQRAALDNPVKVEITNNKYQTVQTLDQRFLYIPSLAKETYFGIFLSIPLVYSLITFGKNSDKSIMVFCDKVRDCAKLYEMLHVLGIPAYQLHGSLSMHDRKRMLQKFKKKSPETKIMICTDIASRGLDIEGVDFVINFSVPFGSKDYVHRVGRTARAGKSGTSLILVTENDLERYKGLEGKLQLKLKEYDVNHENVCLLFYHQVMLLEKAVSEASKEADIIVQKKIRHKGNKHVISKHKL